MLRKPKQRFVSMDISADVQSEASNNTLTPTSNEAVHVLQHGDDTFVMVKVAEMDLLSEDDVKDEMNKIESDDECESSSCSVGDPQSESSKIQKIKKNLRRKERLSEKRARKIKVLQQTIRRLSKRYDTLKRIARKFKNDLHLREDVYNVPSTNVVKTDIIGSVYQKNKEETTEQDEVCRACLVSDARLAPVSAALRRQYSSITSTVMSCDDGKPQHLCWECAHRVAGYAAFVERCLSAEIILASLYLEGGQINCNSVASIDRAAHGLCSRLGFSQLTVTVFTPETKREHPDETRVKLEDSDHLRVFSAAIEEVDLRLVKPEQIHQEVLGSPSDDCSQQQGHSVVSEDDNSHHDEDDLPLIVTRNTKTEKKMPTLRSRSDRLNTYKKIFLQESDAEKSGKLKRVIKQKVKKTELKPQNRLKFKNAFNEDFARLIILSLEEQRAEFRQRIDSLNYKNSPYKCDHCFKGYVDETTFKNHMARHDEASGEHVCRVCAIRYDTAKGLRDHELKLHSRRYQCKSCPHRSVNTTQAHQHQKTAHLGQIPTYVCNVCGKTFKKISTHLTHVRLAHPSEFVCTACGDSFIGEHGLFVHRSKMHKLPSRRDGGVKNTPPQERFCVECNLQFDNVEAYRKHTVNSPKHTAGDENICRVCGEKFSDTLDLIEHRRIHRKDNKELPKTFECKECEKKFRVGKALTVHIRRVHLGLKKSLDKNIVCELCGKSFTCRATLRYHQTKHTGERPYPCGECHKRFRDPQQLFLHRRTHTKEQPYRCAVCGKCFSQKCNLTRHMIIHSGEKPFECSECGRCFNQNSSLKGHVNAVHLGLPPPPRKSRNRLKHEKLLPAHAF